MRVSRILSFFCERLRWAQLGLIQNLKALATVEKRRTRKGDLNTGSPWSFHATSSIGGSIDNVAGAHHWFLVLLEAYCMLHQILRSMRRAKAREPVCEQRRRHQLPRALAKRLLLCRELTTKNGLFHNYDDIETLVQLIIMWIVNP